jgi:6-phosphogluconolactonase
MPVAANARPRSTCYTRGAVTDPAIDLRIADDAGTLATTAATFVAERAREAVERHGRFGFAVSGGRTPWAMFGALRRFDLPWSSFDVYQVDERIAPAGDQTRNLTHLLAALPEGPDVHPMPVEDEDLEAAATRYANELPARFDLIHLGLGADGHTASLVPGDPVLEATDRLVAITAPYQGERRMTLTFPALERAVNVMWLVEGADKAATLRRLLGRDPTLPAGRVAVPSQVVFADRAAAGDRSA